MQENLSQIYGQANEVQKKTIKKQQRGGPCKR